MSRTPRSGGSPGSLDPGARRELIDRLRRDGRRIATHFGLAYEGIDPENARVKRRYGSCHSDGRIKIRLTHVRTGRPLKYSSMVDTLCHELAHLQHFNHGPRFKAFYFRILDWAREQGIYSPGPDPAEARPGAGGARAGGPGAERTVPPPPGLWQRIEELSRQLHGRATPVPAGEPAAASSAPPRAPARSRPGRRAAAGAPDQLGLFG